MPHRCDYCRNWAKIERYSRSDAAAWVSGVRVKVIVIVHFRSLKPTPPQTTNKTKLLAFFSSSLLSNYILPCRQETIFPCSSFIKIKIQKHRPFFGSLGLVKATLLTDLFTSWHIYTTGSVWVHMGAQDNTDELLGLAVTNEIDVPGLFIVTVYG